MSADPRDGDGRGAGRQRLRIGPELTFALLDETIDSAHVPFDAAAVAAFDARRAEGMLIATAIRYVLNEAPGAWEILGRIDAPASTGRGMSGGRWLAVTVACRLPRRGWIADIVDRPWGKDR